MYINTLVVKTEKMVLSWKHKSDIESKSTTECGHLSKQEVCFSIQSGDPLTTVARAQSPLIFQVTVKYILYKDNEVVKTQTSFEFSWTLKLRSTHLTVSFKTFKVFTCLETRALNFSHSDWHLFRNTETQFVMSTIVVIVHFHQSWCGHLDRLT